MKVTAAARNARRVTSSYHPGKDAEDDIMISRPRDRRDRVSGIGSRRNTLEASWSVLVFPGRCEPVHIIYYTFRSDRRMVQAMSIEIIREESRQLPIREVAFLKSVVNVEFAKNQEVLLSDPTMHA